MGGEARLAGPLACFLCPSTNPLSLKPVSPIVYQNKWFLGGLSEEVGIPALRR